MLKDKALLWGVGILFVAMFFFAVVFWSRQKQASACGGQQFVGTWERQIEAQDIKQEIKFNSDCSFEEYDKIGDESFTLVGSYEVFKDNGDYMIRLDITDPKPLEVVLSQVQLQDGNLSFSQLMDDDAIRTKWRRVDVLF